MKVDIKTKAELARMREACRMSAEIRDICANAVAPGVIQTDMCASVAPEVMEELRLQTPLERLGSPEDVAQAVVQLTDAEFITGQVLGVNGGFVIT